MSPPSVRAGQHPEPEQFDLVTTRPARRIVRQIVEPDQDAVYRVRRPPEKVRREVPADAPKRINRAELETVRRLKGVKEEERRAMKRFSLYNRRYKLVEQLGAGGAGIVYRARDTLLDLDVAIKLLAPRLQMSRDAIERFKGEAVTIMGLSHEHIVKLHNVDVIMEKRWFLVMEYVDGATMADVLAQNRQLTLKSVLGISHFASRALVYAHRQGVIHRDLKPANIMLTTDGVLKIVDFGTALWPSKRVGRGAPQYIEGTPCYMSPEQVRCDPLDVRTDIYSLGLILYECLAGAPAFAHDVDMRAVLNEEAPALPHAPRAVVEVISKAIAKDREQRWDSVKEFNAALAAAARSAEDAPPSEPKGA